MARDAIETTLPIYDVVIVGAGPCGLAVAARLCERLPSALYTDAEVQRYYWLKKHCRKMNVAPRRFTDTSSPDPSLSGNNENNHDKRRSPYSIKVFDKTAGTWLGKWKQNFDVLQIRHLRSPLFFHVNPGERDGLLAFSYKHERMDELREITGVVGRELSKHRRKKKRAQKCNRNEQGVGGLVAFDERDRKDYFTPSTELFDDHCLEIIDQYRLADTVTKAEVTSIDYKPVDTFGSSPENLFVVTTDQSKCLARTVVLAIGAVPSMPSSVPTSPCICHSSQLTKDLLPANVRQRIDAGEPTNVAIIGGGLTSAQVSDLAVNRGAARVWHFMRGPMKVKPFDVDLAWIGKFKNLRKAAFWTTRDLDERLEMIATARNGGSINQPYAKILRNHVATGRVILHTYTSVSISVSDPTTTASPTPRCLLRTDPPIPSLPEMDFVIYCTGGTADFSSLPFLAPLMRRTRHRCPRLDGDNDNDKSGIGIAKDTTGDEHENVPVTVSGGLPNLTEELALALTPTIPLFVTGRLAALQLGPGAGNLEGAREGAERVAWGIEEFLASSSLSKHYRGRGRGHNDDDVDDGDDNDNDNDVVVNVRLEGHNAFGLLGDEGAGLA